jgi:hypothetical protein
VFPNALQPLVEQVEEQAFSQPSRAIEAARQLLKHCNSTEQLAYVYEQLGFAHLILGEHRLSCLFYEQARALQPRNMYVLANLAHALYELGEREKAVQIGREALMLKDQHACQAVEGHVEPLQAPYHGPWNLISFSLYGQLPRYCEMAVLNVLAAQRYLPDFVCRFYLDGSTPPAVVQRLQALGAQSILMGEEAARMPATFWRFLAMDDEQADCVLVRDVDALIDARDAWCVQDWRQSGQAFHVIRDDCCHTELILAGLLGIRAGVLRGMKMRIERFLHASGPAGWKRYADQLFLRHVIWPAVRNHTWTHDQVYGYGEQVHALKLLEQEIKGPSNAFIGANHATTRVGCQFERPLPTDGVLHLTVQDETGVVICRYAMQRVNAETAFPVSTSSEWEVRLPRLYEIPLQSGRWSCHLALHTQGQEGIGEGSINPKQLGIEPAESKDADSGA